MRGYLHGPACTPSLTSPGHPSTLTTDPMVTAIGSTKHELIKVLYTLRFFQGVHNVDIVSTGRHARCWHALMCTARRRVLAHCIHDFQHYGTCHHTVLVCCTAKVFSRIRLRNVLQNLFREWYRKVVLDRWLALPSFFAVSLTKNFCKIFSVTSISKYIMYINSSIWFGEF